MGVFAVFFLYPIVYAIYISFYDWGVLGKIEHARLGQLPRARSTTSSSGAALKNTLLYTAVVVPAQMALGLSLAIIVNGGLRGKSFFRAAFYFPSLASSAAITAIAIYILTPTGC